MTLYEILGVPRDATPAQIKSAYRARSRENHPDKAGATHEQEERQKMINAAWEVLKDPEARAVYDRKIATPNMSAEDAERLHRQLYDLAAAAISMDRVRMVAVLDGFVIDPKVREFAGLFWEGLKRKILTPRTPR